ncbi:hypothetical protein ACLB2K_077567 [Fragaria x ananassa]
MKAPIPGIPLKLYLATTDTAVGALLVQDDENGEEHLVYYVSRLLGEAEARYPRTEKICLALVYEAQRHGVSYKIVTDNGTPFVNREVSDILKGYGVKHRKSTLYYPQRNDQAEATNKTLLRILSKMVFEYEKGWSNHPPDALWAYCMSPQTTTGFSPYSLVYGSEAISPVKLTFPTTRVLTVNDLECDASSCFDWRLMDLEAADEQRQQAEKNMKAYHKKVTQAYNRIVKERCFKEGDLVLKIADWVRKQISGPSKFAPQWDGPFVVKESHNSGYYVLVSITSGARMSPINGKWLKLYYC